MPASISASLSSPCVHDDEPAVRPDEERLGEREEAVVVEQVSRAVVHERIRDLVAAGEAAGVRLEVVRVDADHHDSLRPPLPPGSLEPRRFLLAREAPRGPEVQHDRLPTKRLELEAARLVEPFEVERRRLRMLAAAQGVGGPALGVAHDPPDEHREQREDDRDRQHLAGAAQADGHYAEMMNTGVPTFTCLNSHSAEGIAMRMQPWEAE